MDFDSDQGVITLTIDFHKAANAAIKALRGAKWVAKRERWELPERESDTALDLADQWGWVVSPSAQEIGERSRFLREEAMRMSKAVDADLFVPELNKNLRLRPFQLAGVAYAVAKRQTFIADEVGLGKTVSSLAACSVTGRQRILVICKASLVENWVAEVKKWFPSWSVATTKGRKECPLPDARVVVIGYPVIAWRWKDINNWSPDAVIVDESHMCKTPGNFEVVGANNKVIRKKKGTQVTAAAKAIAKPVRDRDGLVLLLSATPIQNKRYIEWWPQLEILGQDKLFTDWQTYIRQFCAGRREFGHWVADGATNGQELHRILRENCFVRRRKADVLSDLPPWEAVPLVLPFTPDGAKAYKEAEDDIISFLMERARQLAQEAGEDAGKAAWIAKLRAEAAEHLVRVNTLRRVSGQAKMGATLEWVDEFLMEPDKKLVVFAHHREIQAQFVAEFSEKYQCAAILTHDEQRHVGESPEDGKQRFQEDPNCRVIVCGPGAKEGHTLTAADTVLVSELPWVPTDLVQQVGRVWGRLSDIHGAQLVIPLGGPPGSIDHRMWDLLSDKQESVDAATDGFSGGNSAKQESMLSDLVVGWATGETS